MLESQRCCKDYYFNDQFVVIQESQNVHEVIIMQENFLGCACIQQTFQPKNVHR